MSLNSSKTSELSQNGYTLSVFGAFNNASETYHINTPGITNATAKKNQLRNYIGQEIATVTLPSPYKYSINPKQVTRTEYFLSSYSTNEGKTVTPSPTPQPPDSTPDIPNQPAQDTNSSKKHSLWIQSGCEAGDGMFLEIDYMNTTLLGIHDLDVATSDTATLAMDAVKEALQKVTANRSKIGAQQNRLEHTIANEENVVENTSAAESRIRDTDMAKEMVQYSNINILEQVGHAMMAQANQSNQGVLTLLT